MKYKISGDNLQVANVSLAKNDIVNAEAGAMVNRLSYWKKKQRHLQLYPWLLAILDKSCSLLPDAY